ncbi:MAG: MBOAT family protein, partial [Ruminococcaceae bacterium]|nr:MBOAT family protein [Oscillospiraceae bacterium]
PIGRANELLPQYKEEHKFDYGNIVAGLQRFLMGAFKKVVLADGMALLVNEVYGNLYEHQGLSLITAVILYSFQLYFDFAGYTDMAVGSARLLGFRLRENFRQPYFATDMGDFWSRWHMSLTTWFNDYIFTPLVWSRWANKLVFGKKWEEHKPHFAANLIIVFLISGLWHGAGMTYVLWGLFHGAVRAVEELISRGIPKAKRKKKKAGVLLWFCRLKVFVIWTFSLIIFRAATISDVGYILANMFRGISLTNYVEFLGDAVAQNISSATLYYALFAFIILASLIIASALDAKSYRAYAENSGFDNNPLALYKAKPRWALYWVMGISTMFFYFITLTSANGNAGFIYLGF